MNRISDSELLDMWLNKNKTQKDLERIVKAENKTITTAAARGRVERILSRWQFESQGLPVPELWK